jgi:predicted nucleic acid-binding protein
MQVVIDSSVLVGLLVTNDIWHTQAVTLWSHIEEMGHTSVYFDCVAGEAISVAVRRLHEKKYTAEMGAVLDQLNQRVPRKLITWIFPEVQRMYPTVIDLMRASKGALNFNDALIALACRERNIPAIASFDSDFDSIDWLQRLSSPEDLAPDESTP